MFFRILKNDLKRKKTMNIILLLFIILASTFVASGVNNVLTVSNGTDYYLDKAGIGDYNLITMGSGSVGALDDLVKSDAVKEYRLETVIFASQGNFFVGDKEIESRNSAILQDISTVQIHFYDENNEEISEVAAGDVIVTSNFLELNDLKIGDTFEIRDAGVDMELRIAGRAKDALLGSSFMGNIRFLLNTADYQALLSDPLIREYYQGQICYIDTDDIGAISRMTGDIDSIAFDGSKSVIRMCYVMDLVVAFIILVLSVALILVSFVVLKFTISFTIREEYREIGVMKAIGITNTGIRGLYLAKYAGIAVIGSVAGCIVSFPVGDMLMRSVSDNMVLGNDAGRLPNIIGSMVVIAVILWFAWISTGKVKKASPIDAIRSGQTGERYKKKAGYRIRRSHMSVPDYMAVNDVVSSPRRYMTIVLSFLICTMLILVVVITVDTMRSDSLIWTFAKKSDAYITDVKSAMEEMALGREATEEHLREIEKTLSAKGMPAKTLVQVQYKYKITTADGDEYKLTCMQDIGASAADYPYIEGDAPRAVDEMAITEAVSEKIGAGIGDTIVVDYGDERIETMITGVFNSMNQLGEIVRLHEDAPTGYDHISSIRSYQVDFADSPDDDEIANRIERIKEIYHNDTVFSAAEYCADCVAVVDTMETVQGMLVVITMLVVILVTVLMERSFIADEMSQIAVLKATGFTDGAVIRWHIVRFALVGIAAVLLAAALSIPMTHLCITPIYGMMGASEVDYHIVPARVFGLYPGMVLAMTVLVATVTAQYSRTVKASDTASIE